MATTIHTGKPLDSAVHYYALDNMRRKAEARLEAGDARALVELAAIHDAMAEACRAQARRNAAQH